MNNHRPDIEPNLKIQKEKPYQQGPNTLDWVGLTGLVDQVKQN